MAEEKLEKLAATGGEQLAAAVEAVQTEVAAQEEEVKQQVRCGPVPLSPADSGALGAEYPACWEQPLVASPNCSCSDARSQHPHPPCKMLLTSWVEWLNMQRVAMESFNHDVTALAGEATELQVTHVPGEHCRHCPAPQVHVASLAAPSFSSRMPRWFQPSNFDLMNMNYRFIGTGGAHEGQAGVHAADECNQEAAGCHPGARDGEAGVMR